MRGTVSAVVIALFISLASPVSAQTSTQSRRFATCEELSVKWSSAIGKDDRSRTAYIDYRTRNYYKATHVVVKRGVYLRNVHLDTDRDGVLCEEYFERRNGIRTLFQIVECKMGGGSWDVKRDICVSN